MAVNTVWTRALVSCLLILSFCLQSFAQTNHCKFSFATQSQKITKAHWEKPGNIFSNSLTATITSSMIWLTAVQAMKYLSLSGNSADFLTTAFMITVPLDVGLTITSHWISLGKLKWLKSFAEGSYVKPKFQFWSRVAANVSIASLGIIGSWGAANALGANVHINSETILAAILLCALVYPSLQVTKPYLFNTIPNLGSERDINKIKHHLGESFPSWKGKLTTSARLEGIDQKDAEKLFIQMLDLVLSSHHWENNLSTDLAHKLKPKTQKLLYELENFKTNSSEASFNKIAKLRQKIIKDLLELSESKPQLKNEIAEALQIDSLEPASSLAIHQQLLDSRLRRNSLLFGASVIDQAIAVGFAGGVLLYSTTHWAETGDLPAFLLNVL